MKRNHLWITILLIAIIFAFASCSEDPVQLTDKLGKIGIGGQSKGIATVVSYSSEVEDLYWYYKATKADDGYRTGETTSFTPVAVSNGTPSTPVKGLSGKTLKSDGFSYGLWNIEFRGYTTTTNITSEINCEYKATVENFLVSKEMNYATVEIKLGDNPTTEIVFGDIWFSAENILPESNFTLSVTDNKGTVTVTTSSDAVLVDNGRVTFKDLTYAVNNGEEITGEHTMRFTLSQKLSGTGNTTINAAVYTLNFEVKPGTKTTISGDMIKSDQTGAIQINGVQSVPKTILSKVIPVKNETGNVPTTEKAIVKETTIITIGDLKVTYPQGAIIVPGDNGLAEDKNTSDGTVGFEYKGTASGNIGVDIKNQNVANYELSLSAPTNETNDVLITVEKNIGKGLVIEKVFHEDVELKTTASTDCKEYYKYDKVTGILELHIFHASQFYIVSKQAVASIGDTLYYSVNEAINGAANGDTVTLLKDFDLGTGTQYAYQGALVDKDITVDLNGKKYTGQFSYGAFIAQRGKLTIVDNSLEKTGLIKNTLQVNNSKYAALCATKDGAIILNSGTVEGCAYGIYQYVVTSESEGNTFVLNGGEVKVEGYAISAFDYDKITINGGKVTSTSGYALMNNGSDAAPSTMTITGGEVYGAAEAIYHPGPGTCTISGGKLTGGETGIEMRAGTLNVSGGTIVGNATPTSVSPNGNGMTSSGAGIAIAQHTTKLPITVTISGGEISGFSALYESNPQNNLQEDLEKITLSVTGGEFNCINNGTVPVYCADKTNFIKGGTFSSDPSEYVASGYIATNTGNNWVVSVNYVSAVGTTKYSSLDQAFTNASDGDTIKLLSDIGSKDNWVEFTNQYLKVTGNKSITLDLNGKSFYGRSTGMGYTSLCYVDNGSSLKITDSSSNQNGALIYWDSQDNEGGLTIENKGTLVLEAGTIENVTTATNSSIQGAVDIHNNEWGTAYQQQNITFTMTGGMLKSNADNTLRIYDSSQNTGNGQFAINIQGGSIEGKDAVFIMPSNWRDDTIKTKFIVNISGGSFETINGIRVFTGFTSNQTPYITEQPIQITVTGGTFESKVFNDTIPVGQKEHNGVIIQDNYGLGNNENLAGYVTVVEGSKAYLHPTK